jgi:hypothetical protein
MSDFDSSVDRQPFLVTPYSGYVEHEEPLKPLPRSRITNISLAGKAFLIGASVLGVLTGRILWTTTATISINSESASIKLRKHFHPGKKINNGRVNYVVTDNPDQGRVYTREFTAACAYGILAFSVGPAPEYAPYQFEVYNDEYAYSDNDGLCLVLPTYKGTESRTTEPYWMPDDATEVVIEFNTMTHISTVVPKVRDGKQLNDDSDFGDYAIIAKGNFYSAEYYKDLKAHVNSWKVGENKDSFADWLLDM